MREGYRIGYTYDVCSFILICDDVSYSTLILTKNECLKNVYLVEKLRVFIWNEKLSCTVFEVLNNFFTMHITEVIVS